MLRQWGLVAVMDAAAVRALDWPNNTATHTVGPWWHSLYLVIIPQQLKDRGAKFVLSFFKQAAHMKWNFNVVFFLLVPAVERASLCRVMYCMCRRMFSHSSAEGGKFLCGPKSMICFKANSAPIFNFYERGDSKPPKSIHIWIIIQSSFFFNEG